jgi:hypothetical protein
MSSFSFSNLVLSGVQAAAVASVLPVGRYVCTVVSAELQDTKDKQGKFVAVKLKDTKGKGSITARLNVFNKSAKATEIGMEQLKALLVHGGHPDPDNIGDHGIGSIKGLTVGVVVGHDSYNGEDRSQVTGFVDPKTVKGYEQEATGAGKPAIGDDDIPF